MRRAYSGRPNSWDAQNRRPFIAVYIMASAYNGTIYTGVTSDLHRRAWEHREGVIDGFTKQYGCRLLVYYERFDDMPTALAREHTMKGWSRRWKTDAINGFNPEWRDLYDDLPT